MQPTFLPCVFAGSGVSATPQRLWPGSPRAATVQGTRDSVWCTAYSRRLTPPWPSPLGPRRDQRPLQTSGRLWPRTRENLVPVDQRNCNREARRRKEHEPAVPGRVAIPKGDSGKSLLNETHGSGAHRELWLLVNRDARIEACCRELQHQVHSRKVERDARCMRCPDKVLGTNTRRWSEAPADKHCHWQEDNPPPTTCATFAPDPPVRTSYQEARCPQLQRGFCDGLQQINGRLRRQSLHVIIELLFIDVHTPGPHGISLIRG